MGHNCFYFIGGNMKLDLKQIFEKDYKGKSVIVEGWVRNHRKQKEFGFIDFSDGTCFNHLQIVYDNSLSDFEEITKIKNGSAIEVHGVIVESVGSGQSIELKAEKVIVLGDCDEDYPMQPKKHTREFLRDEAYLRPRTNLFQAVFRVRSVAAYAIHKYFQDNGYVYFHAPLITASDCEGAGQMFQVTTLDLEKVKNSKKVDYTKDFFGKQASLTVSGQLEAETFALAYKKTYTFGPTFRAENSNTKTHASEFWMIEPEIAFCDLEGDMNIMEDMLKYVVSYVLDNCKDEMTFLDKFVEKGLIDKLTKLVNSKFTRIRHEDVITILKDAKVKWEFTPEYGEDIAKEHEKYITEYFDGPVFITDWPKDIKAFYMKQNPDGKTVAAADLEVPGAGELIGASQREENYDKLVKRMEELNMPKEGMQWYLNLRRFGGCVHSGFGMGFERLLIYLTGVDNIRDVIPYPRTPGNCDF
jgi:asparaginyl-tRNA synthetase